MTEERKTPLDPTPVESGESVDRRDRADLIDDLADHYDEAMDQDLMPALDPKEGATDEPEDELAQVTPVLGRVDPTPESDKVTMRLEVPFRTILRLLFTLGAIWALMQISGILVQLMVAFLLATALIPLIRRLENRGVGRVLSAVIVFLGLLLILAAIGWLVVPKFIDQGQNLVNHWSDYQDQVRTALERHPALLRQYNELVKKGQSAGASIDPQSVLSAGTSIVSKILNTVFVLTVTFYLLIEGTAAWKFIARYFTPQLRFRIRRSYPEISRVMSGYVVGQVITSMTFGIFCWIVLMLLHVPEATLLAVVAAFADAVPIVGVFIATAPAVGLALTVGTREAIIVLIAYTIYQQFENYVLAPRVFGNTLQVSALSIMVAVLVGGKLLGTTGVMIALPITAVIPALERVWNDPLPDEVAIAEQEEQEAAIDAERRRNAPVGRRRMI